MAVLVWRARGDYRKVDVTVLGLVGDYRCREASVSGLCMARPAALLSGAGEIADEPPPPAACPEMTPQPAEKAAGTRWRDFHQALGHRDGPVRGLSPVGDERGPLERRRAQ